MVTYKRFMFSDRILFETAEAELQPLGQITLTDVGELLQHYKTDEKGQRLYQSVQIEGHTDNVPIVTPKFSIKLGALVSTSDCGFTAFR